MEHTTRTGAPKILERCMLPITGLGVVNMIVTDLAVIHVTPEGLELAEVAPSLSVQDVQKITVPKLKMGHQ